MISESCNRRCVATHVFCGGTSSYVLALRMGGQAPHLGLVVTQGSLAGYSIIRDATASSNDRGCFVLHPEHLTLAPGEQMTLAWQLFPCADIQNFFTQAAERSRFLRPRWDRHVLFRGETAKLEVTPSFNTAELSVAGQVVQPDPEGVYRYSFAGTDLGEHRLAVQAEGQTVWTRLLVKEPFEVLTERRCRFIAQHQQHKADNDPLDGAYLIFDNDTGEQYYNCLNDYNAGRERVGMGLLMATYLRRLRDGSMTAGDPDTADVVEDSLERYTAFVRRELVDVDSGQVFNDIGRDVEELRWYNTAWYAHFFLARYRALGDPECLATAVRIVRRFYDDGGLEHYPIEMPVLDLCSALGEAGMQADLEWVRDMFSRHGHRIAETGSAYPPVEVNYEQSIVAPAVDSPAVPPVDRGRGTPVLRQAAVGGDGGHPRGPA